MVNADEGTRSFITDRYKTSIENNNGQLEASEREIMQEVDQTLKREDTTWDDVKEMAEKHQEKHGLVLRNVISFVDHLDDGDIVKSSETTNIHGELEPGKKQAIKTQLRAQPGKENVYLTNEEISNDARNHLTEEIYEDARKCAFIISNQHEWQGRISLELNRTKEKYTLTKFYTNKDGDFKYKHFNETMKTKGLTHIQTHSHAFYEYKFISDDKEYRLLSMDRLEPMRATIKGTKVSVNDLKQIGEKAGLEGDQELIFVHSVEPAIKPMNQGKVDEFRENRGHEKLASNVLGEFRHPEWYEKMLLFILMVKNDNGYPSHLMQMAEPGTGKSVELESISKSMDEGKPPFTGTSSTIKGLVPSFSESPPDEGFLMRSDRVAAVDEMFNLLSNTIANGNTRMQDAFRPMLDLLEHSSREFSSGNGSITGKTEATMLAMGNPAYGLDSIYDAVEKNKIDEAFLSRFILYDQLDSHIQFIDNRKSKTVSGSDQNYMPGTDDEFVSLMDTMRMRHVKGIDGERTGEIHEELGEIIPVAFKNVWRRYTHHIQNFVAGAAKYHYLVENRDTLEPRDKDYELAREIMEIVVSSWGDVDRKSMSYSARVNSLNDSERRVYQKISDEPGIVDKELFGRLDEEELSNSLSWILTALNEDNLVEIEEDTQGRKTYHPYWTDEAARMRKEREEAEDM